MKNTFIITKKSYEDIFIDNKKLINDKFKQKYLLNLIDFNIGKMENILYILSHRIRKEKMKINFE